MNEILALLQEFVVIPALVTCLILVQVIKQAIPETWKRYLPIVSCFIGVAFVCWILGGITPTSVTSGLASGFSACYLYDTLLDKKE